jgi:hypothetical protein
MPIKVSETFIILGLLFFSGAFIVTARALFLGEKRHSEKAIRHKSSESRRAC